MQDICQIIGAYKNKNIKAIKRDELGRDFFRLYYSGGGYILYSIKELCKILKKAKEYRPFFEAAKYVYLIFIKRSVKMKKICEYGGVK